jgi:hypothetical protein
VTSNSELISKILLTENVFMMHSPYQTTFASSIENSSRQPKDLKDIIADTAPPIGFLPFF